MKNGSDRLAIVTLRGQTQLKTSMHNLSMKDPSRTTWSSSIRNHSLTCWHFNPLIPEVEPPTISPMMTRRQTCSSPPHQVPWLCHRSLLMTMPESTLEPTVFFITGVVLSLPRKWSAICLRNKEPLSPLKKRSTSIMTLAVRPKKTHTVPAVLQPAK